ncbi:hypothetical protein ARMSODRAFT_95778 [Armillaria solidipes]|uniref:Uncharacterized protein n=1 Tax=Armillaria solidipes TaxID=1076256 RepID=A0A2H3BJA2_9AGAR|nr:hypothetical protein ARMSODRAFT_95778 [Armillaria solidipes]
MWLFTSAFYSMYYRVYSVTALQRSQARATRASCQILPGAGAVPRQIYLFPPISLPQIFKRKKAGGAVEYDYPAPILDPELEKKRCMVRIKAAYAQGFHGTTHEIPDGSADDILQGSYKEALGQVDYADSRRRFHVEAETGRRWR